MKDKKDKTRNVRAEIDTKREALMRRTMACDERVKKCEKMIEIMQRSSERNLVVLSNRCLTTTIGVEEGEREERGRGGRVGLDYDYDFNDDLLPIGAAFWAQLVRDRLPVTKSKGE